MVKPATNGSTPTPGAAAAELSRTVSSGKPVIDATAVKMRPTRFREEDVFAAWDVISPAGHSVLTKSQLLDTLRAIFPTIGAKQIKDMVGNGNMSIDKLKALLFNKDLPSIDANDHAFKLLDPSGRGVVDKETLKRVLLRLPGIDTLDDDDMALVMQLADADSDGVMSFQDFACIGSWAPERIQPTQGSRKLLADKKAKAV